MTVTASARSSDLGVAEPALRRDEPLARHTSMRVGGPADLFVEPTDAGEVCRAIRFARREGLPVFLLGGGTNLVVSDRGIRGLVLKLGRAFAATAWSESAAGVHVEVGGAANLKRLVGETIARGLAGLEFAEGIPGTVGGGVLMNAGAFGGELSDVVDWVEGVDRDGEEVRLDRADLPFSYRRLDLPAGFVVTRAGMTIRPGDPAEIQRRAEDARRKRSRHQPVGFPNAGSIFKNPPGDFAGRLLELVGVKGLRVGNAGISPRHANFILNLGDARAAEVRELMVRMRDAVWRRRGVRLQPEVKLVGEWEPGCWSRPRTVV